MKKNFRILSFWMICVVLFFFLALTPQLSTQTSLTPSTPSEPTLSLEEENRRPSSEVVIIKTPLHLTPVSEASKTVPLPVPPQTEAETTPVPESTPASESESAPAPGATPASNSSDSSSPSKTAVLPESTGKVIPQGGYPESHFWEKKESTPVPQSSDGEAGTPTTSNSTSYTREELFSDAFLNESPMTEKGKPGNGFRSVSQNGGLDVIPKSSGINGRSLCGPRTHIIEDGDSLDYLALRYLGDSTRTDEIFEANRSVLPGKEELPIGAVLVIPERF